ncbi:tetratricopeptide repeat protein [Chondromyces crocatus]|uniref:TIR domain-containing protein n=1 Tax=Chondromyces crocatus TaxID=52 RepID=A0A0K1ET86_CHOCO|nr:tetratricopeptide repeat protein [Chondromyces crocatus]AKT44056.1 uncharacterized protein CMC5_082940 [Chondromyces crocatus]
MAVRVFISYAHKDETYRQALETCLKQLQRQGLVDLWHDRKIAPGGERANEISAHLDQAHLILLLVSQDFLASDYCTDVEVDRALERHRQGEAQVVPVILRHCTWDWAPFATLQALPTDGLPIKAWSDQDEVWTQIARALRVEIERRVPSQTAAAPASACPPVAALPAPGPCVGRESILSALNAALLADEPPRILIRGVAGIGKSTVSLVASHAPDIAARYGARRYFVRLDAAKDADGLVSAIALALRSSSGVDLRQSGWRALDSTPALLLLDNLETPWDHDPTGVETVLAELAALPELALVVSIRRGVQPGGVAWSPSIQVEPLRDGESEDVYCAIAGDQHRGEAQLQELLGKMDGVPLAITLLAHAAQGNELTNLVEEWEARRTRMLERGPGPHRSATSWSVSLELSLQAPGMTDEARRLAALLGVLPDGVAQQDLRSLMQDAGPTAARVLAQHALAYFEKGRLRMLAPVREYVELVCPPAEQDLGLAMAFYGELVREQGPLVGRVQGARASARLGADLTNLQILIGKGLNGENPAAWLDAAIALSNFGRFTGLSKLALLEQTLALAESTGDERRAARCAWHLGEFAEVRSAHEEAKARYEQARLMYQRVDDLPGVARCLHHLGNLASSRLAYDEAGAKFEQARLMFEHAGDTLGEANCLHSLGNLASRRSAYDEAEAKFAQARLMFERAGDLHGEARCLDSLGNLASRRSEYGEARAKCEQARLIFQRVGDVLNEAYCVHSLGDLASKRLEYDEARAMYEQARLVFQRAEDNWGEANCNRSLGELALSCSEYDEARAKYEQARSMYQRAGDTWGEAHCKRNLGDLALRRLDYEEARAQYEQARSMYQRVADILGEASCNRGLGDIARGVGNVSDALPKMISR